MAGASETGKLPTLKKRVKDKTLGRFIPYLSPLPIALSIFAL
jgi:hypothetical protein